MKHLYAQPAYVHYVKALVRFRKNLLSGQFARYSKHKRWQIWNRLCRYARQLGIRITAPAATACLAAGFSFTSTVHAQTYVLQSGAANPFNGLDVVNYAAPFFVDIDNNGVKDAFVGGYDGTILYYKNTGTISAPVFTLQTGTDNPLNGVDVGFLSFPSFVDIDNDGDKDVFIGGTYGNVIYYKNTGSASVPVFTPQTGADNPLNGVNVSSVARPSFTDIDGDGDMDLFIGKYNEGILYYRNTGTAAAAVFTQQTGAGNNPLNGVNTNFTHNAALADLDGDGDADAFISTDSSIVSYYKNTGTTTAPVFIEQTSENNPLADLSGQNYPAAGFVDIDNDGDIDVFVGLYDGTIRYYKNTALTLPVQLLGFSGKTEAGHNQLLWQTARETNTRWFEVEWSSDGRNFTSLASIQAAGSGSNRYSTTDRSVYTGKVYYRLKMTDADGRFTYSQIIWINNAQAAGVSLYPNPVSDVLNINIGSAPLLKTYANLYSANGLLLRTLLISGNQLQIPVQSLTNGVYMLKFADGTIKSFIKK